MLAVTCAYTSRHFVESDLLQSLPYTSRSGPQFEQLPGTESSNRVREAARLQTNYGQGDDSIIVAEQ